MNFELQMETTVLNTEVIVIPQLPSLIHSVKSIHGGIGYPQ